MITEWSRRARSGGWALLITAFAVPAGAQEPCPAGPGAALGVIALSCASCAIKVEPNGVVRHEFRAEPMVMQVASWSRLRLGDVIEALNGLPILTTAGSRLLTDPPAGTLEIVVRRDGARTTVRIRVEGTCPAPEPEAQGTSPGGDLEPGREAPLGIALACAAGCLRDRTDGAEYWRFATPPRVVAVTANSPAERAGLRVDDRLVLVDGLSILTAEGALRLSRAGQKETLHLEVERGSQRLGFLVRLRRGR
jgi:S1-C subfamily serine protease